MWDAGVHTSRYEVGWKGSVCSTSCNSYSAFQSLPRFMSMLTASLLLIKSYFITLTCFEFSLVKSHDFISFLPSIFSPFCVMKKLKNVLK